MNLNKVRIPSQLIESYCQEHYKHSLAIFGSFTRDDFGPGSDVDILVEFKPGHIPGFVFFD